MKKIKLDGKLNLNKTNISKLNEDELNEIQGGLLSITAGCTQPHRCKITRWSRGIFCKGN